MRSGTTPALITFTDVLLRHAKQMAAHCPSAIDAEAQSRINCRQNMFHVGTRHHLAAQQIGCSRRSESAVRNACRHESKPVSEVHHHVPAHRENVERLARGAKPPTCRSSSRPSSSW